MNTLSLQDIIIGENSRLIKSEDPFLETGFMGSSIALFYLYRLKNEDRFLKMAESHLDLMRNALKDKKSLEINNGLSGVGLGLTWLVEQGFISGDLNLILKDIDDIIYKYCVRSFTEYNPIYESTYIDMILYMSIRINYLKNDSVDYLTFVRLSQMLYDHVYLNITMGFMIEPRPANIRYKLFLFVMASWLLCKNGDEHIKGRISNVFNELFDILVTVRPFCAANRYALHQAIDLLLPYLIDNKGKWENYVEQLENSEIIDEMLNETLDNDMSVFHGIPYIYLLLKINNLKIPYRILKKFKNRIENAISVYSDYNECERWGYVGFSGILGTTVVLEHIKAQLSYE